MNKSDLMEMIMTRSGTVMLVGKPGTAKTAILQQIAQQLGYEYVDLRLPMLDEVDVGGMVTKQPMMLDNGKEVMVTVNAYPQWAVMTRERPTLVVLEELNRASKYVQNAALGIMHERRIGNLELGEKTIIVATGNCGESDGTDVEEFDAAVRNRIIKIDYDLSIKDWIDNFASRMVDQFIVEFIVCNPSHFYMYNADGPYATPRSWTYLSDFIGTLRGSGDTDQEILLKMQRLARHYVGAASAKSFCDFMIAKFSLSIEDVLRKKHDGIERSNGVRLLRDLRVAYPNIEFEKQSMYENLAHFLSQIEDDVVSAWLIQILESVEFNKKSSPNGHKFLNTNERLRGLFVKIKAANLSIESTSEKVTK